MSLECESAVGLKEELGLAATNQVTRGETVEGPPGVLAPGAVGRMARLILAGDSYCPAGENRRSSCGG